jgi:hypoxanthine phosphoribosyltransferase
MSAIVQLHDKQFKTMISEDLIRERVKQLGADISAELEGTFPLFVAVLNGAFVFAADLLREITIPCEITFVKASSYSGMQSTGEVKEIIGLTENIKGRDVVIVEDIVDSGLTIDQLIKSLRHKGAGPVRVATAFFKRSCYKHDHEVRYAAFEIPEAFVAGYGLDYNGAGRNLKALHVIA